MEWGCDVMEWAVYRSLVQRSVWVRGLIALWSFWITAALSGAPGLQACAQHGGHAADAGHAMDHGHLDHAGHTSHRAHSPGPADASHHAPCGCPCFGLCCCAAQAVAPAPPIELAGGIFVAPPAARCTGVAIPGVARAYSHPFANGPPAE